MKKAILPIVFAFLICAASAEDKGDKLVVHEWGTFTSLQDEKGDAIGGINTDDEPLPNFVHRLAYNLLLSPSEAPPHFFQGAPSCHPDVTMRLETPVIYFHPPAGWKSQPVDVHVAFRGGWLTEFYPDAIFNAPGFDRDHPGEDYSNRKGIPVSASFGHIKRDAVGELSWKGIILGGEATGPETAERVWLAPRDVKASMVKTGAGESEKFLFYRGVGNVDAPLRIIRDEAHDTLQVQENRGPVKMPDPEGNLRIPAAWLVDVRPDGTCAFKPLGKVEWQAHPVIPASFAEKDFSPDNIARLRDGMNNALVAAGLFADEAQALLNTWQISYFKSPGLRFFYICPRVDVDNALPLEISVPSEITRVMVGRIEIVTPGQRALLKELAAGPAPDLSHMRGVTADSQSDFFKHPENLENWDAAMSGKKPYSALGLPIPPLYAEYLKLGRFRNALILDEQKRRPTPALGEFIGKNGFEAYKIE